MKIQIYLDAAELDLSNIEITNFKDKVVEQKAILENMTIDIPPFNQLKGNKDLLQQAFLNQMVESLNL
jgi:hypothetical protein